MSQVRVSGNASGTGVLTVTSPNTNSNYTLTLPAETGTILTTVSGVAVNGPAFSATAATNQTGISNVTFTKVNFATENFDTNNNFASSRFTPTVAGYYQINAVLDIGSGTVGVAICRIYQNGGSTAFYGTGVNGASLSEVYISANNLIYCNGTTDYLEIYVYMSSSSNVVYSGSYFSGFLARAA